MARRIHALMNGALDERCLPARQRLTGELIGRYGRPSKGLIHAGMTLIREHGSHEHRSMAFTDRPRPGGTNERTGMDTVGFITLNNPGFKTMNIQARPGCCESVDVTRDRAQKPWTSSHGLKC